MILWKVHINRKEKKIGTFLGSKIMAIQITTNTKYNKLSNATKTISKLNLEFKKSKSFYGKQNFPIQTVLSMSGLIIVNTVK